MRINKFVALASGMSRRAADEAISSRRVLVNGDQPQTGQDITEADTVTLDDKPIAVPTETVTIMLNKPVGYVCSRNGQGSKTVYDLLPPEFHNLKPVGRLDKDSSGLLLLTNDGDLAHKLTHPSFAKQKVYEIMLDKTLEPLHRQMIQDHGVKLQDGVSKFSIERQNQQNDARWLVTLHEGRNRQIRRTFAALDYTVLRLHRIQFGSYLINDLELGTYKPI